MFERKAYQKLLDFKKDNGKYALLIEGARRVGKSTLAEEFAKREYRSYILVNFSQDLSLATDPFQFLPDLDYFFSALSANYNTELFPRESLIIFDEVQEFPLARSYIKYLVKDGRYDFIETGSLISIHKKTNTQFIPSEEDAFILHPMDFEEFLWARGKKILADFIRQCFENKRSLGPALHKQAIQEYRHYLVTGGMPQVVAAFLDNPFHFVADRQKQQILRLYRQDMAKLDDEFGLKAGDIFDTAASNLGLVNSRFRVSSLRGVSDSTIRMTFKALEDSQIFHRAYDLTELNVNMKQLRDDNCFKLYFSDTGLLISDIYNDQEGGGSDIYRSIISDTLSTNQGYIYENAVAQAFASSGRRLYYYTFRDDSQHRYELDFLLRRGKKLMPIEVKSTEAYSLSSLKRAMKEYSSILVSPTVLWTKDSKKEEGITYLPLYMAGLLD